MQASTFDVGCPFTRLSAFAPREETPNAQNPTANIQLKRRAGEGNRTPVCSLGSCRSAIELHPRSETFDFRFSKPTIIGSPNQFKVYSFRDCRLQPKQIVRANRLFTLGAVCNNHCQEI